MNAGLAIVTGGSTGIGQHLVGALTDAGYAVAFSYRSALREADELTARLRAAGRRILPVMGDVGIKADVDRFLVKATGWHGAAPTLLVNNAGIQTWSPLLDLPEASWDDVVQTNLKGCFLHIQSAGRMMADAGRGGSIVNIGSGCNKLAFPNLVDYTASKGGIEQLTKSAAVELGRYGITVNCVAPGAIVTARTIEEAPDYEAAWAPLTPLGRAGTPEDIAGVVLFLASRAARFVTGQTIGVDGGIFSRAPWPYPA